MLSVILCTSLLTLAFVVSQRWETEGLRDDVRTLQRKVINMADVNDQILAKLGELETAVATENGEIDKLAAELRTTPPEDPRGQQILDRITALTSSINGKVASIAAPAA